MAFPSNRTADSGFVPLLLRKGSLGREILRRKKEEKIVCLDLGFYSLFVQGRGSVAFR